MNTILLAVIVVAGIGLIAGLGLSLASVLMAVKTDEKVEQLRAELPGANCGACGYAGCDEYAKAVAAGEAATNLCIPGADAVAAEVAGIMGAEAMDVVEMIAHVRCNGTCTATDTFADYQGIRSCAAMSMIYGGPNVCKYGCLGCGDCAAVCPNDAICVIDGVARINAKKCIGCGLCAKNCPKGIIEIIPQISTVAVACSNLEKGAVARKKCKNACIGCKKCELGCEQKAITVQNNVAVIDYDKCNGCNKCAENCPTKCIKTLVG